MAKSKIIKEIVNNEIDVTQALDRLYLISYSLSDNDVCSWIKNEKEGYKSDVAPSYRKTVIVPIGTYQIISAGKIETYTNAALPTSGIPEESKKQFDNWVVRDSIISLIKQKEMADKGEISGIPLDPVYFGWFQNHTNILMRKAFLHISPLNIETILSSIKTKIIDLLLLYEDNFGVLDNLDIDISNYSNNQVKEIHESTKSIIDGTFNGKTKIIIKNSNIGEKNTIDKKTDISTDVNVTINKKERKGLFSVISRLFKRKR